MKTRTTEMSESARACARLLAANVIQTLKDDDPVSSKAKEVKNLQGETTSLVLRHELEMTMALAERLIAMPEMPPTHRSQSNSLSMNKPSPGFALSCKSRLGIWHTSDDAVKVLKRYPLQHLGARVDLPYFVLWALHAVLPDLYQTVLSQKFNPTVENQSPTFKPLPEPTPYDRTEPPFEFRNGPVFGNDRIHPEALAHTFITGATGAGKTYGAIKPFLQSFLTYRNAAGTPMGLLVIDPKSELLQFCLQELEQTDSDERLFRVGSGQKIKGFAKDCALGLEDRYRMLAKMFQVQAAGEGKIWQEKGNRLNLDMAVADRQFQLQTGYLLWGVVRSLIQGVDHTHRSQWENIHAIYKFALISKAHVDWLATVSTVLMNLCPALHGLESLFSLYLADSELGNQLFYRVSNAEQLCKDLSAPEVVNIVNTDLFAKDNGRDICMQDLVTQGKVILCQPSPTHFGDIAARLVKGRFFEEVLARTDMKQPVGYVCDEFQRFITSDRETGEQSFIDRCRAYRVSCVLATQSLSSLEHALVLAGEVAPQLVVNILVANTPTKIVYKTLDTFTQDSLRDWIPPAPGLRKHVVDVRPPAQLPIGHAYYLCNGKWGLYRYKRKSDPTQLPRATAFHTSTQDLQTVSEGEGK